MTESPQKSIYTLQFALLCLSSLLFSSSFNMIIPELPNYLSNMGGAEYKGLIIALFTLTAGISRPFSGKLTDRWGRVPIMAVGSVVCFFCGFLYPVLTSVSGFLMLRLIHGFSTGFKPTATSAYVADIIPRERWGEALGLHGLCFSIGGAVGPAIGSAIFQSYGINTMFYSSSVFALLSIVIVINMKETLKTKEKLHISMFKISRSDIIDIGALPAGIVTFLSYSAYGVILTLIPDWSEHLGLSNKGVFFTAYTITSILIRFVSGKVSDRYGRTKVIMVGLVIVALSLYLISEGDSFFRLMLGASVYGIGTGILSPAVNAWTIDLSHPQQRGRAVATMYIALEAGIGLGALCAGFFYQDIISRIPQIMLVNSGILFVALAYMFWWEKSKKIKPTVHI
ncbi:transporter, major facilitator family protein [Sphingobacterium spiritivorum ATCC 33300]|uniref:Transporter, major facilitator family protein n=1 Tax=Sphingobacterium spiritivorum ATCC 33300 TaxID=525372 RepID=C2FXX0_SPHSI|nr:MFS transporter [Sphingobacterium spiritivorum]EEI92249.1 transporter, major facilitator family protein [Sphingobacterium spiritivorum ATCC 33300]QQS96710.1 MFS transporter [Sphingobacterium spiritivorum]